MATFDALLIIRIVSALTALLSVRYFFHKRRPPLPPGPRGLPFFGNMFDLPKHTPWVAYAEMGKKWGTRSYTRFTLFFK